MYLATDPEIAYSFIECSEFIDNMSDAEAEMWLGDLVVLKIDADKLDKSKLFVDENVQDNDGTSLEYHGIISSEAIVDIVDEDGESLEMINFS